MDRRVPDGSSWADSVLLRRALLGHLVGLLGFLCILVLRPFLSPILWAAILAYVTWPLYRSLRIPFRGYSATAACVMTLVVVAVAIVPLFWLLVLIQHELVDAYGGLTSYLSQGPHTLPAAVRDIPWFGAWLQESLNRYTGDPAALGREITGALQSWTGQLAAMLGGVGRNVGKLLVALLTLFFFYRDGDLLVRQIQGLGKRLFGDLLDRFAYAAGKMTRAVVYGLLITALAQGSMVAGGRFELYSVYPLRIPAVSASVGATK